MRIEHLQFLVEVARTKSISAAAKRLYISQTGLSAIISSIEEELNLQIFHRTNKGICLTAEGEQALKLMEDILLKNDELHYLYSDMNRSCPITNLGVFPSGAHAVSAYLTPLWAREHPEALLHIYDVGYEEVRNCISNHTANIVIGMETSDYFNPRLSTKDGKTQVESLCLDHFCLLVGHNSPLAQKDQIQLEEALDCHLLLTHSFPGRDEKPIGHVLRRFKTFTVLSNLEIAKDILTDSSNMAMVVPTLSVYQDKRLEDGRLKLLEIHGFDTALTIYMMYDIASGLNVRETVLLQEIRDFFSAVCYPV